MNKKTYRIVVENQEAINEIELMLKSYIVKGKNIVDAFYEAAKNYNLNSTNEPKWVTEQELLQISKDKGLTSAKSSVVQYRRKGVLGDENGPWYFQNNQRRVVYDLDKMLKFLEERKKSPKSKMKRINDVKSTGQPITVEPRKRETNIRGNSS